MKRKYQNELMQQRITRIAGPPSPIHPFFRLHTFSKNEQTKKKKEDAKRERTQPHVRDIHPSFWSAPSYLQITSVLYISLSLSLALSLSLSSLQQQNENPTFSRRLHRRQTLFIRTRTRNVTLRLQILDVRTRRPSAEIIFRPELVFRSCTLRAFVWITATAIRVVLYVSSFFCFFFLSLSLSLPSTERQPNTTEHLRATNAREE